MQSMEGLAISEQRSITTSRCSIALGHCGLPICIGGKTHRHYQRISKEKAMQTSFQKMLLAFIGMSIAVTAAYAQPLQTVKVVARGGGKTIIEGGTGQAGGFVPVITTIAFHADRHGQMVSGDFECLALVPSVLTGNGRGQ